jgi:hypothetical protein
MPRRGAVAAEQLADFVVGQAEHHMREIHRRPPRKGDVSRAPRRKAQLGNRHGEGRSHHLLHQPADLTMRVAQRRLATPRPGLVQDFQQSHRHLVE